MKLKTLFAITVIVNSTCPQTFYHIFAYSSLDFLQEIYRMPRFRKKCPIMGLFSFDTEFHSYYTQPIKEDLHKKEFMANFGD